MTAASRSRGTIPSRAMRLLFGNFLLVAFVCLAAFPVSASAGQDSRQSKKSSPDLESFVGTWKASFNGEVFATLTLKKKGGQLTGTLNNFDVSFDKEGNLADGTHRDLGDAPLLNPHFQSGALFFVVMEKDAYHPSTTWKFVPRSTEEGELTLLLDNQPEAPQDRAIRPIRMYRAKQ
ncbi:MAG TPA: hypothetical protein VNM68_03765 [Candidatus Polarisedimenticolia bacterium]|nr:hypothetical protein [Candidatus Polarisedimenticolia bacterium]